MNESVQPDLSEDHFAAVKSDASIELYSISKAFEDLSVTCDAVVAKDLLKGLLHDRGKGMKICGLKNNNVIDINRFLCQESHNFVATLSEGNFSFFSSFILIIIQKIRSRVWKGNL